MDKDIDKFSPMMQNYLKTKEDYKDCILFYRLGDFYEMFFDDAILASKELELTLTGKDCGLEERAPMSTSVFRMYFVCSFYCRINVWTNVLFSDHFYKACFLKYVHWLFINV